MHLRKLVIILILFGSLAVLYYGNRWLQRLVRPRASFGRFLLYMLSGLLLVFAYSFAIVLVISKLFPLSKR